jgi:hypothetical protein
MHELAHTFDHALDLVGGGFMPVSGTATDLPTDPPPVTHPIRLFATNG